MEFLRILNTKKIENLHLNQLNEIKFKPIWLNNEIEKFLKQIEDQAKLKESKFKKLVADGNNSFNKKDYSNAVLKFEEALKIKNDNIVSKQLANAKKNLELANAQNQLNKQYDDFIKTGDNSLSSSNYTAALDAYNKAKKLMPGNQIAYDKIKNIIS